jgi:hypothetical protein
MNTGVDKATGLQKVLKIHGEIHTGNVVWVWDYKNDCPKKKSEMTKAEYAANKKYHKGKGQLHRIGADKIEYGEKPTNNNNP